LEFFVHLRQARRHTFLIALLGSFALAHASAGAQTVAPPSPDITAIAAVVSATAYAPPVLYRSVFVDTPTGTLAEETDWKKANADVGQFKRGHIDILRWESAQAPKPQNATKTIAPDASKTGATP
jgi:hypothetical protein